MNNEVAKALQQVVAGSGATMVDSDFRMKKVVGIAVDGQQLREIANASEDDQHEFEMGLVREFHARLRHLW